MMMTAKTTVPRSAVLLGAGGLLPTLAAVAAVWLAPRDLAAFGFSAGAIYGATILSFIGGAWWGLGAAGAEGPMLARILGLSVVPSLVAGAVLVVLSAETVTLLAFAFVAVLLVDQLLARSGQAPVWWLRLRIPLSLAMAVLHLLLAIGYGWRFGWA